MTNFRFLLALGVCGLVAQAVAQEPLRWLTSTVVDLAGPNGPDVSLKIVEIDEGGYYLVGWTSSGGGQARSIVARRVGLDGRVVWRRLLSGGPTGHVSSSGPSLGGACTDGQGGLVIAGSMTWDFARGYRLDRRKGFLVRFDAGGHRAWTRRFSSPSHVDVIDLARDGQGGFLVTGFTNPRTSNTPLLDREAEGLVARVGLNGGVLWDSRYLRTGQDTKFFRVAPDGHGGAHCFGQTHTPDPLPLNPGVERDLRARFNASGHLDWVAEDPPLVGPNWNPRVAADGDGGTYVAGHRLLSSGSSEARIERRDESGQLLWSSDFELLQGYTRFSSIRALADGTVLIAGTTNSMQTGHLVPVGFVATIANRGTVQALDTFPPASTFAWSSYWDVAVDSSGGLFVLVLEAPTGNQIFNVGARCQVVRYATRSIARLECLGQANSTGQPGRLFAEGDLDRSRNRLTLWTEDLPVHSFGFFLASQANGFVANPGGSEGNLCLGGDIARYIRPFEMGFTLFGDGFHLDLSLDDIPAPSGTASVLPGVPWFFQAWYRDTHPSATTNFTDAIEVVFQ